MVSGAVRDLERTLRSALVTRLQQLSIAFHDRTESGRLQAKVLRDVEQVQMFCMLLADAGAISVFSFIFAVVVTAIKEPRLLLFFVLMAPLVSLLRLLFGRRMVERNSAFRSEIERMSSDVAEMPQHDPRRPGARAGGRGRRTDGHAVPGRQPPRTASRPDQRAVRLQFMDELPALHGRRARRACLVLPARPDHRRRHRPVPEPLHHDGQLHFAAAQHLPAAGARRGVDPVHRRSARMPGPGAEPWPTRGRSDGRGRAVRPRRLRLRRRQGALRGGLHAAGAARRVHRARGPERRRQIHADAAVDRIPPSAVGPDPVRRTGHGGAGHAHGPPLHLGGAAGDDPLLRFSARISSTASTTSATNGCPKCLPPPTCPSWS